MLTRYTNRSTRAIVTQSTKRYLSAAVTATDETIPADDNTTTTTPGTRRNKAIAHIIREGWSELNESAVRIQANRLTQRSLFQIGKSNLKKSLHDEPGERQLMEKHRLMRTINEALQSILNKQQNDDNTPPLSIDGDPMLIVNVQVKPSLRSAIVEWSLPLSILMDLDDLTFVQREYYKFRLQQALDQYGAAEIQRRVSVKLRKYYPPKLVFKVAQDELVKGMLPEVA